MADAPTEKSPRVQELQNYLEQFARFPPDGLDKLITFSDRNKDNLNRLNENLGYFFSPRRNGIIEFARMTASSGEEQAVLKALPDAASKHAMQFLIAHPDEAKAILNAIQSDFKKGGIYAINFLTSNKTDIQKFLKFATEHTEELQTLSQVLAQSKDGKITLADVALHPSLLKLNNRDMIEFARNNEFQMKSITVLAQNIEKTELLMRGLPGIINTFGDVIEQKGNEVAQQNSYNYSSDKSNRKPPYVSPTIAEARTTYQAAMQSSVDAHIEMIKGYDTRRTEYLKQHPDVAPEWKKKSLVSAEELKKFIFDLGCTNPAERNWFAAMEREAIQMAESPGANPAQQKQEYWEKLKKHALEQPHNAIDHLPFPSTFTTYSSEALEVIKPVIQKDLPAKQQLENCKSRP